MSAQPDNAALNGVEIRADLTPLQSVSGRFDLVVANLFAEVLVALADDLKRVCAKDLAVAGVLADRADTVVAALAPCVLSRSRSRRLVSHEVCLVRRFLIPAVPSPGEMVALDESTSHHLLRVTGIAPGGVGSMVRGRPQRLPLFVWTQVPRSSGRRTVV